MQAVEKNIIQAVSFDLDYYGAKDPFALQEELGRWAKNDWPGLLGNGLDKLNIENEVWKINRLELELQLDEAPGDFFTKLSAGLVHQLEEKLSYVNHVQEALPPGVYIKDAGENFIAAFVYFLQHGNLPWWSPVKTKNEFLDKLQNNIVAGLSPDSMAELKAISTKREVQQRLIFQLPGEILYRLLQEIMPATMHRLTPALKLIKEMLSYVDKATVAFAEKQFKICLVENMTEGITDQAEEKIISGWVSHLNEATAGTMLRLLSKKISYPLLGEKITGHIITLSTAGDNEKAKTPHIEADTSENSKSNTTDTDDAMRKKNVIANKQKVIDDDIPGQNSIKEKTDTDDNAVGSIYTGSAGLVIVAGFLPHLFKNLGLLKGYDITNIDKAINIVQYIASGNEASAEFEMGLAKILCGADVQYPVDTSLLPGKKEKEEADKVLQSVIEYWSVLKDTSVQGLRESFILRDGKLSFSDSQWLLQVEQRPFDMLLQNIPWNISMVKLPWMKAMVKTEWVY